MSPDLDVPAAPYTGWTRKHWEDVADRLLAAPRRYATPGHGLIHLPGPASRSGRWSDAFEGFARTFVLAGFRLAGAGGADPDDLAGWYARGIASGVDPSSPERWPTIAERKQAAVEAASVAIALHETRPWIWDRLSDRARQQAVDWLAGMVGATMHDNNWVWFQNVVETFLASVGGPWDHGDIERNLAAHERWYLGDGWYTDGGTSNFDYYAGWAMHFYPAWYVRMGGPGAGELAETYRERLRRFLLDAQHLVAADGAPVFQGRSLTYRFAMLAPFWAGELSGASPLAPGLTRRLANGVLRHFVDRGAIGADGLLPLGWYGAFPRIRQLYSGGGSPYWASKGFAGLLLPPEHPVWTHEELPLPLERDDVLVSLPAPGWIVAGTTSDGIVRVVNHGTDRAVDGAPGADLPFYTRHGYATHAAPELLQRDARQPMDSTVALLDTDGVPSHRTSFVRVHVGGDAALGSRGRSRWWDLAAAGGDSAAATAWRIGPWLTTASVVRDGVEVRLARMDPADAESGRPGTADDDDPDAHLQTKTGPWRLHVGGYAVASDRVDTPLDRPVEVAAVTTDRGITSAVVALRGLDGAGVSTAVGTNPLGLRSAVPWVGTTGPVTPGEIHAAAVVLTGSPDIVDQAAAIRLDVSGDQVTIQWPSGERDTVVVPGPPTR
ncbi:DUF2264 domain-containing protein [Jiangella gansuensis]|uniref:DUF2264 domain-containing protein n=1 Tax=Jiangella gansuensis TaxID=281473 RepID=UPI0004B375A5|nr:DUF2264 domain-containing protein [Jiangella gansuensis]